MEKDINTYQSNKPNTMQIYLFSQAGSMDFLWLSANSEGRYQLGRKNQLPIYVDVSNKGWTIRVFGQLQLRLSDGSAYKEMNLKDQGLIHITAGNLEYTVYSEISTQQSNTFQPYQIIHEHDILIGRDSECDISYHNSLVSRSHAKLWWHDNILMLTDENSTNGTFLNGKRVDSSVPLALGDVIFIMGLKIIIGIGFISVNKIGSFVNTKLSPMNHVIDKNAVDSDASDTYSKLFNRLPRRRTAFEPKDIFIEAPPFPMNNNQMPLLLRMGGSMVYGGRAALTGNYTMLLTSLIFPFLSQKYTEKEKADYEVRRVQKYSEYLSKKKQEIQDEVIYEQNVLMKNYPDLRTVLSYPLDRKKLWERRKNDDDFLNLRLGYGTLPMCGKLNYPKEKFEMDQDQLEAQMLSLANTPVTLKSVPIMVSLTENFVWGIKGNDTARMAFIRQLLMRISVLYSYDEVKLILLVDKNHLNQLEFARYLPHLWNDEHTIRFIATSLSEAYQIGEYLRSELEEDVKKPPELKTILKKRPYYIVFALNKPLFDSIEILKDVMQADTSCGASIIAALDAPPKECSILININSSANGHQSSLTYLHQLDKADILFSSDIVSEELSMRSMKIIANTKLKVINQSFSLPKTVTFLEMFKVGKVEHLNPSKRWKDNNPVKSIATPVGVATDGTPFMLDLHQKFQGPHGLVAGMTGSGKSEFLLTYILSLAVNYHPYEVAFLLIDYKGGGLAGSFDDPQKGIHLPHLIGTITNLDGATIQRSLVSIQSELMRRQRIFNEVKNLADGSTVDIYKYQQLFRKGLVKEPLPHLFIISDEFAELKQQQPDFMENLISTARIGRSLGVHLILATQKPSGVVNDQIRSNTKFRVCLKVQEREDSVDMLKRPEAAELKDTGRFYLQVGYNEFFALGQSAWSGASYKPQDEVVVQRDDSVQVIDSVGQNIAEVKPKIEKNRSLGSQIYHVVKLLSDVAKSEGIEPRSLWKPALPERIDFEDLNNKNDANAPYAVNIGMVDDPENLIQFPMKLDFEECQNLLIVGGGKTGKSSLLKSMIYTLCRQATPEQLNIYLLDFSSRSMKVFSALPHCGAVLYEEDMDQLNAVFELLSNALAERKKLFTDLGVDNFTAAKKLRQIPLILVFIDNINALNATKSGAEILGFRLQQYMKEGPSYGIKYILTANHLTETSTRMRQEIGGRLCLSAKDKYDVSDILNCSTKAVPSEKIGRGLAPVNGNALEIQFGMMFPAEPEENVNPRFKECVATIAKLFMGHKRAKGLPVISETATYREFSGQFSEGRIPLGYSKVSGKPVALPLKQLSRLSVYFGNTTGALPITENFIYASHNEKMSLMIVKRTSGSIFDKADLLTGSEQIFTCDTASLTELWQSLGQTVSERNELLDKYLGEQGLPEEDYESAFAHIRKTEKPILLFIESMSDFCSSLDLMGRLLMARLIDNLQYRNIYAIGCYEPENESSPTGDSLYHTFGTGGHAMFFGGNFMRQSICNFGQDSAVGDGVAWNVCVMRYGEKFYPLLMPCGEFEVKEEDIDSVDIFE